MQYTEFKSFYPFKFTSRGVTKTTESSLLTSGGLTIGNVYFISKSGNGATSFDGAVSVDKGNFFTASGSNATFDGAEIEDITTGKPIEESFFYGAPLEVQFKWQMGYNEDGLCVYTVVTDLYNNPISI